ncbi:hypothetical protein Scep_002196 [Stephania cephalantha]|uniref:Uncharacterized protein n=1 Tax=Stephania cephalantha TaxID=152367 RepID=A0AAP0Q4F8_9MAGN
MPASAMDELENNGKYDSKVTQWLSSLSYYDLDLLISLKQLVLQRAKVIGHSHIAKRFDLKILRALGFVLMKHFKNQLIDSQVMSHLSEASVYLENINFSKFDCKDLLESSMEDTMPSTKSISRKRKAEGSCEGLSIRRTKEETQVQSYPFDLSRVI